MARPKVLFDLNVIAHYRVPWLNALAEKFEVIVIASTNKIVDGLKDVDSGFHFRTIRVPEIPERGWRPRRDLYHPQILDIITKEKPQILISFSSSLDRLLTQPAALNHLRANRIKTIWMGCDGYLAKNPYLSLIKELANPKLTAKTLRNLKTLRQVDYCLPYSSHTARYLHQARFVPYDKIRVAHNAIDTTVIRQTVEKLESEGATRNPLGIVFTGRLTPRKGVDILLRAFALVSKKFPLAHLDIIGEGSEAESLQHFARSLGLSQVSFVGPIYDDANLATRLYQSTIAVMPGLGGLGFNTAMAASLPIIYTHADGTEEDIIRDNHNGWYFDGSVADLARALTTALEDPNRNRQMGQRSAELVASVFNLENMVRVYSETILSLYEKSN